ncbi:ABC transporter ATP-binding protein [Halopseudomonas pelagia]|uniref:ABC transporter ATP-binding protein n=1 Tax=Halopseudomonas pelagia TaxID=553151 RepID=UPI00039D3300|nr:ABC transporter ATP-binding protein [Halopseudomonas pelagia]|tara:strand:- start:111969 stop:112853 length:885 start_codon:yes stop_codon:yes gene_type:complete
MLEGKSARTSNTVIELSNVTVRYGGDMVALDKTRLHIDKGDFVALVGPSGCGKSTILKLVAGLLEPTEGAAIVGGREVGAIGSHAKRLGLAFQNPTMLPWLSILDNVMIPLKIVEPFRQDYRRKKNGEFRERAEALLEQVGLAGFGGKRPWELSGGMLQRASLCRALVHEPDILLLDEPFGALDQFTREELWDTMQALWMAKRPTVLLVTHDLRESAYLANRICVMSSRPGRIIQDQSVEFARPRTLESSYEQSFTTLVQELRMSIAHARSDADTTTPAATTPAATPRIKEASL